MTRLASPITTVRPFRSRLNSTRLELSHPCVSFQE